MKQYTTSERLKQIMKERSMRQIDILNSAKPYCERYGVKLGKNALSQYVSGKVEPGQEKLSILGIALNVSEAWLMGYEVPMNRETITPATISDDGRTEEFLELFRKMTPEQQDAIMATMRSIQPK